MLALLETLQPHIRFKVYAIWVDGGWSAVAEWANRWGIEDVKP